MPSAKLNLGELDLSHSMQGSLPVDGATNKITLIVRSDESAKASGQIQPM